MVILFVISVVIYAIILGIIVEKKIMDNVSKNSSCCGCVYEHQWQPSCHTCSRRAKDNYTTPNQYYLQIMEEKINE